MAESAGAGGYTLNTVSVSEATQHSTNTITQGGASFGDYSTGWSSKQLLIAGATAAVIAYLAWRK